MRPLFPMLRAMSPRSIATTEQVGRAMIAVARSGAEKTLLENQDITSISQRATSQRAPNTPGAR